MKCSYGVRDILYLVLFSKGGRLAYCLHSRARTIAEFHTVSLGVYMRSSGWRAALSTAGVEGAAWMTAIDLDQMEAEGLLTTHRFGESRPKLGLETQIFLTLRSAFDTCFLF